MKTIVWVVFICNLLCIATCTRVAKKYPETREQLNEFAGKIGRTFADEYIEYDKTGIKSDTLKELISTYQMPIEARYLEIDEIATPKQAFLCVVCRSALETLLELRRSGADDAHMHEVTLEICVDLNVQPPNVCSDIIAINMPIFMHVVDSRPSLNAETMCGMILQGTNCVLNEPATEWTVDVDAGGPPITGHKNTHVERTPDELKIIHITDPHYDPAYVTGNNAVCGEPACCRIKQGLPTIPENAAGHWGDYRDCDSPYVGLVDAMNQIVTQHPDIDYVYFTGDIIDHGVWETTFDLVRTSHQTIFALLRDTFGNIPVFPTIGNHESQPTNQFAPSTMIRPDLSTQWLYDLLADEWSSWLPESTMATIRKGGYYTTLVRPGLRVIALNNQDCYTNNWWLMYDFTFPRVQLQWLHDTLLAAESANEKVHILKHIPSGEGSCFRVWSREYRRILDRFWNTISAQFNGHTHKDEFNVFYSISQPDYAINVAWNGGSVTPFSNVNYNYRMYYADPQTYQINDHDTWIYNLTEANLYPERNPIWFKEYTFNSAFNVANLSPESLDELVERFASDPELLTRFWEFKVKMGDPSLAIGCDSECLGNTLCEIVINQFGDNRRCDSLLATLYSRIPSP